MKNFLAIGFLAISIAATAQTFEASSNSIKVEVGQPETRSVVEKTLDASPDAITLETLGITKVPKYYALIIGVSNYQHAGPGLDNLDMPVKDAEKFANIL